MHIYQIVAIVIASIALLGVIGDVIYLEIKRRKGLKNNRTGD